MFRPMAGLRRWWCRRWGHSGTLVREWDQFISEVVCHRCGGHYLLDRYMDVYMDYDDVAERYAIIQVSERRGMGEGKEPEGVTTIH